MNHLLSNVIICQCLCIKCICVLPCLIFYRPHIKQELFFSEKMWCDWHQKCLHPHQGMIIIALDLIKPCLLKPFWSFWTITFIYTSHVLCTYIYIFLMTMQMWRQMLRSFGDSKLKSDKRNRLGVQKNLWKDILHAQKWDLVRKLSFQVVIGHESFRGHLEVI